LRWIGFYVAEIAGMLKVNLQTVRKPDRPIAGELPYDAAPRNEDLGDSWVGFRPRRDNRRNGFADWVGTVAVAPEHVAGKIEQFGRRDAGA
jgi:hypothetical protein